MGNFFLPNPKQIINKSTRFPPDATNPDYPPMKILILSFIALGALVSQAAAQVAVGPGAVKLGKPDPEGVKSPEYSIVGGPQKRSKTGTWLEVEVPYETKVDDIDELTFQYMIMVDNIICDGTVTYVNIPKGKDHYAVMYLPPRALEKLTGGKPLSGNDIQNVWVTVTRQGQILDQMAFKPQQPPNLPHQAGLVLNKNETPFSPLFYDRYEAIKAAR